MVYVPGTIEKQRVSLHGYQSKKKILTGSSFVLLGKMALIPLAMANKILMARLLGPASFGALILFLKICDFASLISLLGTKTSIIKSVGIAAGNKNWDLLRALLKKIFLIVSLSSAAVLLLIEVLKEPLTLGVFNSPALYNIIIFCFLVIPLQNYQTLVEETFRGMQKFKATSLIPVVQYLSLLLLLIGMGLLIETSINNILLASTVSILVALGLGLLILRQSEKKWPRTQKIKVKTKDILAESLPMMITSGTLIIMSSTDVYVLGIFTSTTEVGIYGVVNSLATMTIFSLGVISQVIPGMIAQYNAQKDFKKLNYVVRYTSTLGALFTIPITIILLLFGRHILVFFFGPEYVGGSSALALLVVSQMFRSLMGACGYVMQMTGLHVSFMTISIFSGILNLMLNLLLVGKFGINGVATATAISLVAQNLLSALVVYRRLGLWALASWDITREIFTMLIKHLFYIYRQRTKKEI